MGATFGVFVGKPRREKYNIFGYIYIFIRQLFSSEMATVADRVLKSGVDVLMMIVWLIDRVGCCGFGRYAFLPVVSLIVPIACKPVVTQL